MATSITLRQPSTSTSASTSSSATPVTPPSLAWLRGSWNVTHSTLPMWKKSRNVRITYTPLPSTGPHGPHIDDEVSYQAVDKSKSSVSTVRGIDKPFSTITSGADTAPPEASLASLGYNWRGRGWLVIASSKWEILGYGAETGTENDWVVTYFAKTLFTPAGLDFYSRKGQLQSHTVEEIKGALQGLGGEVANMASAIFEVAYDGEREEKA
jgi:hypothetical protein